MVSSFIFLKTPTDYWMLKRLDTTWYVLLIAGCCFLFLQFVKKVARNYAKIRNRKKYYYEEKEYELEKQVRDLWEHVDDMCEEDRAILKRFVEIKNKPYVQPGGRYYSYGRLLNSELVHSQKYSSDGKTYAKYMLVEEINQILSYSVKSMEK